MGQPVHNYVVTVLQLYCTWRCFCHYTVLHCTSVPDVLVLLVPRHCTWWCSRTPCPPALYLIMFSYSLSPGTVPDDVLVLPVPRYCTWWCSRTPCLRPWSPWSVGTWRRRPRWRGSMCWARWGGRSRRAARCVRSGGRGNYLQEGML